jgi:iron complex transport system substrate-binding protein
VRAAPLLRVLVAALLLAGCGGGGGAQDGTARAATTPPTPPATAPPATTPPATTPPATTPPATAADLDAPLPAPPPPTPSLPATVTSADGIDVTVQDAARIVPLTGGIAEIVFSLGLGDRVVARDEQATFPEAAHLPVVTQAHSTSAEGVLSVAPTVVLGDPTTGPPEVLDQLRGAGIPVVLVEEAWTLEDIAPRVRQVAAALGVPAAGEDLIRTLEAGIAAARRPAGDGGPPTVAFLYVRGTAGVYLLGGDGSGADSLVEAVGAVDAGSALGLQPFTPLTSEALVAAAPDVILVMRGGLESVGGLDGLLDLPGVAQTPAGAARRVIAVEDGLLLSFGARTPAVLAHLATELDALLASGSTS